MKIAKSKRPIYCWDTTVTQAWFGEEADKPLADIEAVVREIDADKADLLFSITTYEEILDVEGKEAACGAFRQYRLRSNVETANVDPRIAEVVASIRSQCCRQGVACPKASDAQVIATAIVYGADVLHTFDRKMLKLDRHEIVGGLRICHPKPISGQLSLTPIAKASRPKNPHLQAMLFSREASRPWGVRHTMLPSSQRSFGRV